MVVGSPSPLRWSGTWWKPTAVVSRIIMATGPRRCREQYRRNDAEIFGISYGHEQISELTDEGPRAHVIRSFSRIRFDKRKIDGFKIVFDFTSIATANSYVNHAKPARRFDIIVEFDPGDGKRFDRSSLLLVAEYRWTCGRYVGARGRKECPKIKENPRSPVVVIIIIVVGTRFSHTLRQPPSPSVSGHQTNHRRSLDVATLLLPTIPSLPVRTAFVYAASPPPVASVNYYFASTLLLLLLL